MKYIDLNKDEYRDLSELFPFDSEEFNQIEKTLNSLEPTFRFLLKCREWILFPHKLSQN